MSADDELMKHLRRIADEVDAPSDITTESARAAFTTRHLDDELAALLNDSDLAPASGVRHAEPGPRLLSFEAGPVSLELELGAGAEGLVVRGIAIGTVGDVTIETTTDIHTAAVDENGFFRVDELSAEPVRVRVQAGDGGTVTTGWIRP
jgi:hypothetical protein